MPTRRNSGTATPDITVSTDAGLLDALRCAAVLVDRYGLDADIHLAMRADAAMDAGNLDGARVWCRVLAAIDDLWRATIQSGETRH